jgi:hypothetical protein
MAPTYVDSTAADSTSTSWSVTKPTGTSTGHVLIAFVVSDGSLSAIGTPTGGATWQQLDSEESFLAAKLFWKIAGGSEPSSYGFTQQSSSDGVGIVVDVSGADISEPQHDTSTSGFGSNVATPSLTPVAVGDLDIRFGAALTFEVGSASWSPPSTYTEREDVVGDFVSATCATKTLSSTSATGTQNFNAGTEPEDRLGMTVLITSPPDGQLRIVTPRTAVHRASSW